MGKFTAPKQLVLDYFKAMEKCASKDCFSVMQQFIGDDYVLETVFPFMKMEGIENVAENFWKPIKSALYRMQRRQDIFIAGIGDDDKTWVMSMGQFMGLFDRELLNIRPTTKMQHLQYVEFNCVEDGKITHSAIFLDFLGFMMEAGTYPLPPMTGNYFIYPGPKDHNGLLFEDAPYEKAAISKGIVNGMYEIIQPEMAHLDAPTLMEKFWNDDMIWYGPCGVGASYTIPRYIVQHQGPFREHLSERHTLSLEGYIAEGDFAGFFSSMRVTNDGGWLGMTGSNRSVFMYGDIDVYYIKDGKISENWCMIDIPFWLNEQGVDIFKRTASIVNPPTYEEI